MEPGEPFTEEKMKNFEILSAGNILGLKRGGVGSSPE